MNNIDSKNNLRILLKNKIKSITGDKRKSFSLKIQNKTLNFIRKRKKCQLKVMVYISVREEVETDRIINNLLKINRVFVPRCNGKSLDVHEIKSVKDLRPGNYKIPEPDKNSAIYKDVNSLDFIIVPGIGFDRFCNRLGRGKGYYDIFLSGVRNDPFKIGLAYDDQIVEKIPCTAKDEKVDVVITPTRCFKSSKISSLPLLIYKRKRGEK